MAISPELAGVHNSKQGADKHGNKTMTDDGNSFRSKAFTAGEVEILLRLSILELELKSLKTNDFVSRREFEPVQRIVYGLVGLILVAVVGAIMVLVLK